MGFPVGIGILWDSHGNGNGVDFRVSGNVVKCFVKKKFPLISNSKINKE